MDNFDELYKKLNKAQKEAVDTIEGPVMVIAGPGTGKTTILTLRIANILKITDTPPSGILALTFTDSGVRSMRQKLTKIIGDRSREVGIYTFHSFAKNIIDQFSDHFEHLYKIEQITEIESQDMIRSILVNEKFNKLRSIGEPDFYLEKILASIGECKKEAITPEMIVDFAKSEIKRIENDESSISTRGATKGQLKGEAKKDIERYEKTIIFAGVYKEYEVLKREKRLVDFADLIFELSFALKRDELLLQLLQEKFLYILVDEHQDTNNAQNIIIKMIADFFDQPNLFVVGDEKQAIYKFQGASLQNFLNFKEIWPSMKTIALTENYRSNQNILDASFYMIENNYENDDLLDFRIKLKSNIKDDKKSVDVFACNSIEAEENLLVSKISDILDNDTDSNMAIIVKNNAEISKLIEVMNTNGIEATAERGVDIFKHRIGNIFFNILNFIIDPSNVEALSNTIASGLWSLTFEERMVLIKEIRKGNFEKIEEKIPNLKELFLFKKSASPLEFIKQIVDSSGLNEIIISKTSFVEVWRSIFNLSKTLIYLKSIEDPDELIKELLIYKTYSNKKIVKIKSVDSKTRVFIMTAHSSKGLEFDYVFMPYCNENLWIKKINREYFSLPIIKEKSDLSDERRLFFVALTRAKKHISISYALLDTENLSLEPVCFISEIDKRYINFEEINKVILRKEIPKIADDIKDKIEKINYTKNTLLESGLSVTALNHFLECPRKFFFKSILKLPEAPNPPSEKGTAMHEAIATLWNTDRKNLEENINLMKSVFSKFIQKSAIKSIDKKNILEEVEVSMPIIARSLFNHFNSDLDKKIEHRFESYFQHKFANEDIEIKLHGRFDLILEDKNSVFVYDYKTREAMSENAIKGNTKSSDGNYFKQLVFYKKLLSSNKSYLGKNIIPYLVFLKPDIKKDFKNDISKACPIISLPIENVDIENLDKDIKKLIDLVWKGDLFESKCGDLKCVYCNSF